MFWNQKVQIIWLDRWCVIFTVTLKLYPTQLHSSTLCHIVGVFGEIAHVCAFESFDGTAQHQWQYANKHIETVDRPSDIAHTWFNYKYRPKIYVVVQIDGNFDSSSELRELKKHYASFSQSFWDEIYILRTLKCEIWNWKRQTWTSKIKRDKIFGEVFSLKWKCLAQNYVVELIAAAASSLEMKPFAVWLVRKLSFEAIKPFELWIQPLHFCQLLKGKSEEIFFKYVLRS